MAQFWLYFIGSITLVFLIIGLICFLRRYGKATHLVYLSIYLAFGLTWILLSVFEVLTPKEAWMVFWSTLGATAGVFTIAWMLIFIFYYLENHIDNWAKFILLALAAVFSVVCWTNPFHKLFYLSLKPTTYGSTVLLQREYGPLFAVMICIDAVILLYALFRIFQYRLLTHQAFRRPINMFAYFTILMVSYHLLCTFNIRITPLPVSAIFTVLPGLAFTLSALRANNINLVPISRMEILDAIHDAILVLSPENIILDMNNEMSTIMNKEWRRAAGNPLQSIFPELAARLEDTVHRNTPDSQQDSRRLKLRFMFRYHDKQFDTSIYEHHGNSLVILHDITPLVRRLNTTNQLARNDALTGIHNRRSIETAVTQWLNHHQDSDHSFCFALFDVDHFKQFNDTYGHQVGDVVLKQITVIFNHAIRQTDLFGRFGGDEFILFLTDVNDDQARMILDRAVKNVTSEPVEVESGDMLSPTISMGAVFFPKTGSLTYEEIFNLADEALYYAKENGRNQITFRTRTRIDFNTQLY